MAAMQETLKLATGGLPVMTNVRILSLEQNRRESIASLASLTRLPVNRTNGRRHRSTCRAHRSQGRCSMADVNDCSVDPNSAHGSRDWKLKIFAGRLNVPLSTALEISKLLPRNRHRNAHPWSGAGRKCRRGRLSLPIAQVVDVDLA